MPKHVDHEERRREIAAAVGRIARRSGLSGVSFREVAAEAGMSVALVQHYVGTKHDMLVGTLNLTSERMAAGITARLAVLPDGADPIDRVATIARSFLPSDPDASDAMLVYLQFAAAAMADPDLASAEAFANGRALIDVFASELAELDGNDPAVDPGLAAEGLMAMLLGLAMSVLLGQTSADVAREVLDAHLAHLD